MTLLGLPQLVRRGALASAALLVSASPVFAEPAKIDGADTAWMLVATGMVLMMTIPGLALFYCGMVRNEECAGDHGAKLRGGRPWFNLVDGLRL